MAYTKLNANNPQTYYRNLLKSSLDDFCRFYWKDEDAFEKFGAFIIANKRGDLKFHSGPSITNTYSEPQFGSYGDLLGVDYSTYSISFTVALYYITEDEWRQFLNWMSPTTVSWLKLGFESKWKYQCKINKIAEGSRYILKPQSENNPAYYYAETTLTFDLVGEPLAYTSQAYEFSDYGINTIEQKNVYVVSDLDYPLDIRVKLNLSKIFKFATEAKISDLNSLVLSSKTIAIDTGEEKNLFTISLSNLSWTNEESVTDLFLNIRYLSDSGLLLYGFGSDATKLLSLQESVSTGERIVNYMQVHKMLWPGRFSSANLTPAPYKIIFNLATGAKDDYILVGGSPSVGSVLITGHGLTNVI